MHQIFGPVSNDDLLDTYEQEIADVDGVYVRQTRALRDGSTWYDLSDGVTLLFTRGGVWYAYESDKRLREREYYRQWAAFARAGWTRQPPTRPGVYPTMTLEGTRASDRRFGRALGGVRDLSGFAPYGKITEWKGYFWRLPYPKLLLVGGDFPPLLESL